jgi:uncharacterized alkaline shock family protein YloU
VSQPKVGDTGQVRGTIRVSPAVLIELIELTVRDVTGVVDLQSLRRQTRKRLVEPASATARAYDDGKVRVSVDGDQIDADVAISVERGTNVTELSHEIQRRVGVVAGQMLGMSVTAVNIYVEDIVGRDVASHP